VRAFMEYGGTNVEPETDAGQGCKRFVTIMDGYPRVGEPMIVPSARDGRKITMDELAAQPTQFIMEVTGVHGSGQAPSQQGTGAGRQGGRRRRIRPGWCRKAGPTKRTRF
jgi:hypothetical protein